MPPNFAPPFVNAIPINKSEMERQLSLVPQEQFVVLPEVIPKIETKKNVIFPLPILSETQISPKKNIPGEISIPRNNTIIPPIPLTNNIFINTDVTVLALSHKINENKLKFIDTIDETRLISGRTSGKNFSYSLEELKHIADELGIKKSTSKSGLIERIKEAIRNVRNIK